MASVAAHLYVAAYELLIAVLHFMMSPYSVPTRYMSYRQNVSFLTALLCMHINSSRLLSTVHLPHAWRLLLKCSSKLHPSNIWQKRSQAYLAGCRTTQKHTTPDLFGASSSAHLAGLAVRTGRLEVHAHAARREVQLRARRRRVRLINGAIARSVAPSSIAFGFVAVSFVAISFVACRFAVFKELGGGQRIQPLEVLWSVQSSSLIRKGPHSAAGLPLVYPSGKLLKTAEQNQGLRGACDKATSRAAQCAGTRQRAPCA